MSYTNIDRPTDYFRCKTYSGTGSSNAITYTESENMQPNMVLVKRRDSATAWHLHDSVRGATKMLKTNDTDAETTDAQKMTSFDTNGFTVGTNGDANNSSGTFASWSWKAESSFSNDASATGVGTIDSSGSTNQTAGLSIVIYTGTGSSGTIAHNLGSAPTSIWVKRRSSTDSWTIGHNSNGWGGFLRLDNNSTFSSNTNTWNNTAPTSTVFSVNHDDVNASGVTFVAYCWCEKKGFSKISKYTGNEDSSNPTFVYTAFRPSYILVKKATGSTDSWFLHDDLRDGFNEDNEYLRPNETSAEGSGINRLNIFSNGFTVPTTDKSHNADGVPYIYYAFARHPFVTSTGIPTTAR